MPLEACSNFMADLFVALVGLWRISSFMMTFQWHLNPLKLYLSLTLCIIKGSTKCCPRELGARLGVMRRLFETFFTPSLRLMMGNSRFFTDMSLYESPTKENWDYESFEPLSQSPTVCRNPYVHASSSHSQSTLTHTAKATDLKEEKDSFHFERRVEIQQFSKGNHLFFSLVVICWFCWCVQATNWAICLFTAQSRAVDITAIIIFDIIIQMQLE